jgi:hypothetical protein
MDYSHCRNSSRISRRTAIKLARVTVCNLANDINDIITKGIKLKVLADEFDEADARKAGRNVFGVCRFQLVSTDLACRERLI